MSRNGGNGVVGVMCRTDQGKFMGPSSITFKNITNPTVLEGLACREALALADDLMSPKVFIAPDSLEVIKDIGRRPLHYYCSRDCPTC